LCARRCAMQYKSYWHSSQREYKNKNFLLLMHKSFNTLKHDCAPPNTSACSHTVCTANMASHILAQHCVIMLAAHRVFRHVIDSTNHA
jgi:hypothetical protein